MRTALPSQLVRVRYFFLAGALVALAIGALVLKQPKGSESFSFRVLFLNVSDPFGGS